MIITKKTFNEFDNFNLSTLELYFSNFDNKLLCNIANLLSRISINYIPVYAFNKDNIKIEKNTSKTFNNDFMKMRLSLLPLYNIENDIDFNYDNTDKKIKYPGEKNIQIIINSKNENDDILYVTTNDIKLYINNKESNMYDKKFPFLLIKLKKNESFSCVMKSDVNIGIINSIYKCAANSYYNCNNNKLLFTIKSNGQMNEFIILIKSCEFIILTYNQLINFFNKKIINKNIVYIIIENYDIAFLNLLNYYLQLDENIIFSGINKNNLLINNTELKIKFKENVNQFNIIKKNINKIIDLFIKIKNDLNNLYK